MTGPVSRDREERKPDDLGAQLPGRLAAASPVVRPGGHNPGRMAGKAHRYEIAVVWTGNRGTGRPANRDYGRNHTVSAGGGPTLPGSSDPTSRGNRER